jgi:hypothetical protein
MRSISFSSKTAYTYIIVLQITAPSSTTKAVKNKKRMNFLRQDRAAAQVAKKLLLWKAVMLEFSCWPSLLGPILRSSAQWS